MFCLFHLYQESANYGWQENLAHDLTLLINFYWNTVTIIHLHIVCVCFYAAIVELSKCNKDSETYKPEIFTTDTL